MFNGAFSVSQGVDPTSFSLTDTSVGTDSGITIRQITLLQADGTPLIPKGNITPYIIWPVVSGIGDVLNIVGILPKDYSLNISVLWVSSAPLSPPSTYTVNQLNTFTANLRVFSYFLTQEISANPNLLNDNGFFPNKSKLRVLIDDAVECNTFNDQSNAQKSLDAAYKMQQNQKALF